MPEDLSVYIRWARRTKILTTPGCVKYVKEHRKVDRMEFVLYYYLF